MTTAIGTLERVGWAGRMHPNCRPGTIGTVLKVAHHDPDSVKVLWDDRPPSLGRHTWERRKNLTFITE
jgi:hypothetical protein